MASKFMYYLFVTFFIYFVNCQEIVFYPAKNYYDSKKIRSRKVDREKCTNSRRSWNSIDDGQRGKRSVDPVFRGRPKTKEEIWSNSFAPKSELTDQTTSLIGLLEMIINKYLSGCTPIVLYDTIVETEDPSLISYFFKRLPLTYSQGKISVNNTISEPRLLLPTTGKCLHYVIFTGNIMQTASVIGLQSTSRVVIVARSSQWMIQEYLASKPSRNLVNLLVIGKSFKDDESAEIPYILYTHKLYIDGLGASLPVVLTSWIRNKLARPLVNLFPEKMQKGYAGHRFTVSAANQPPFVYKRILTDSDGGNVRVSWAGIDYEILKEISLRYNFSFEIIETKYMHLGSGNAVAKEVLLKESDIGIAGLYVTSDRLEHMDVSNMYYQDCATFITLTSTALPKYRAILGPFRWEVWLALIITYLFGILPLAFSDKHTLRHLYHNSGEVENMFWYVFGTFTNCFTFVGKNSWSRTTKVTTRLLIGLYWIFTIIITSCYTGSIIAFVTLPIYPQTVDTIDELIGGFYRVGTLDKGGWEHWFSNTSDPATEKLFKHLEYVPDVQAGLKNITKAFFWPYAFLGSRAQLEYIGRVNFSLESAKRSVLHISQNCFVPFSVAMVFPKESVYTEKFNNVIARMFQTGLIDKIERDVKWEMQRSATGKLLKINSGRSLKSIADQEKGLTLDDTQGMFLLLSAGFLMAAAALISECVGGCSRWCGAFIKDKMGNSQVTIERVDSAALPTPETKSNNDVEFHEENDSQAVSRLNKSRMDQIDNISNRSSESVEGHIIEVFAEVNEAWRDPRPSFSRASSKDIDEEIDQIFKMADEDPAITPQSSENGHGGHKSSIFGEKVNA